MNICHPSAEASEWSQELRLSIAESLFNNSIEGICLTDAGERIIEVNPTLCQLTGYSKEELLGKTPRIFSSGVQNHEYFATMWRSLLDTGQWQGELWNRNKAGELFATRLNISAICNEGGELRYYLGIIADITATKLVQVELEKNANHDALTGLPNRILLMDRLHQAMAQAQRTRLLLAICYLDLDGFKPINDSHGHAAGDQVLIEVARRLNGSVRVGDTVARIGGDEFVLLLWGLDDLPECDKTLSRVISDISSPIALNDWQAQLSVSVGVSIFPDDGVDSTTLIAQADSAMYRAKLAGGNRWRYFNEL